MIRVLFVCLGNICRSPMAEAVLVQLRDEAGLRDKIEVDSALVVPPGATRHVAPKIQRSHTVQRKTRKTTSLD